MAVEVRIAPVINGAGILVNGKNEGEMIKMAKEFLYYIKKELEKYGLRVTGAIVYKLGDSIAYHVGALGKLYENPAFADIVGEGYQAMSEKMHDALYYLAPETTSITIADAGENREGKTYLIFVFSAG